MPSSVVFDRRFDNVIDDYENLYYPELTSRNLAIASPSPRVLNCIAAGTAAAISIAAYNPLDCLRVRWQVAAASPVHSSAAVTSSGLISFGQQIVRTEGIWQGLWKPGLGANVMGMAGSSAIRFGYYETVRNALCDKKENKKDVGSMFIAGLLCGSAGYLLTTPFHFLKTIIQAEKGVIGINGIYISGNRVGKEPFAVDLLQGAARMIQQQGITSLWKGALPLTCRGALFTAGQMVGYDGLKTIAWERGFQDGPALHIISSIAASFGASFLSAPADFVMAKYMTKSSQTTSTSLYHCVKEVYINDGIVGFWRGWSLFFLRLTPVMVTSSMVYEQMRRELGLGYFT